MSEMETLLFLIEKFNISKVALANYLNVSRQMVYNYLSMDSIDSWPLDKQIRLLDLFDIKNIYELENVKINNETLNKIGLKLSHSGNNMELQTTYNKLDINSKRIVEDVVRLCSNEESRNDLNTLLTLVEYSMISKEYKYLIKYLSKVFKKTSPEQFSENKNSQLAFEGILFSAFNLFNSKKFSIDKLERVHKEFVKDLENKTFLDNQSTNVINVTKLLAKKELGIERIDESNIDLIFEKMIEIQGRKL